MLGWYCAVVALDDVAHPKKLYPALVGTVADRVTEYPAQWDWVEGAPEPPLAL